MVSRERRGAKPSRGGEGHPRAAALHAHHDVAAAHVEALDVTQHHQLDPGAAASESTPATQVAARSTAAFTTSPRVGWMWGAATIGSAVPPGACIATTMGCSRSAPW